MKTLAQQQEIFWRALSNTDDACSVLEKPDRIQVYRESAQGGWENALSNAYPVVKQLIGERCFAQLARHYSRTYTQQEANLDAFGQHLSAFLPTTPLLEYCPYLADMASLEWAMYEAARTPVESPDTLADFAQRSPEAQILTLSHSITLIESTWPLHQLWQAHQQAQLSSITPSQSTEYLMVFLWGLDVYLEKLTSAQWAFWQFCQQNIPLSQIATQLACQFGEVPLGPWLHEGFKRENFIKKLV